MEKEKNTRKHYSDLLNDLKLSRRSFVKATAATGPPWRSGPAHAGSAALAQTDKAAGGDWANGSPRLARAATSWCSKEVYVVQRPGD